MTYLSLGLLSWEDGSVLQVERPARLGELLHDRPALAQVDNTAQRKCLVIKQVFIDWLVDQLMQVLTADRKTMVSHREQVLRVQHKPAEVKTIKRDVWPTSMAYCRRIELYVLHPWRTYMVDI